MLVSWSLEGRLWALLYLELGGEGAGEVPSAPMRTPDGTYQETEVWIWLQMCGVESKP